MTTPDHFCISAFGQLHLYSGFLWINKGIKTKFSVVFKVLFCFWSCILWCQSTVLIGSIYSLYFPRQYSVNIIFYLHEQHPTSVEDPLQSLQQWSSKKFKKEKCNLWINKQPSQAGRQVMHTLSWACISGWLVYINWTAYFIHDIIQVN